MKFTKIFPPNIKPVHIGVYLVSNRYGNFQAGYSYWNGEKWSYAMETPEEAVKIKSISFYQNRHWRGILK